MTLLVDSTVVTLCAWGTGTGRAGDQLARGSTTIAIETRELNVAQRQLQIDAPLEQHDAPGSTSGGLRQLASEKALRLLARPRRGLFLKQDREGWHVIALDGHIHRVRGGSRQVRDGCAFLPVGIGVVIRVMRRVSKDRMYALDRTCMMVWIEDAPIDFDRLSIDSGNQAKWWDPKPLVLIEIADRTALLGFPPMPHWRRSGDGMMSEPFEFRRFNQPGSSGERHAVGDASYALDLSPACAPSRHWLPPNHAARVRAVPHARPSAVN